jgi:hypothetical protein
MKCDRCKEWHQRTVIFENEFGVESKQERLCLTCIAQLTFGRVDKETEQTHLKNTLKNLLEK